MLKKILNYTIMLLAMSFLLWFSLSNIEVKEGVSKTDFLLSTWGHADKRFLFISALSALLSHFVRGLRWKLLLDSIGYKTKIFDNFYSVMVGYFINLAIPRGGEVSRCYNMYRLNRTPTDISLGTVIAERIIDLILLILFIGAAFLIEFDNLIYFFQSIDYGKGGSSNLNLIVPSVIIILGMISAYISYKMLIKSKHRKAMVVKVKGRNILRGIKKGILSVMELKRKGLFFIYSICIWLLYYIMTISVVQAFPETHHLGLLAAVSIFAIGGIAMAIPMPGGTGSYHVLVPLGLVTLYGLEQGQATAFTFIFHGWQTFIIILFGALSLLISQFKAQKLKEKEIYENSI